MIRSIIKGGLTVLAAFLVFSALRQISLPLAIGVDVFAVAVIVHGVSEGEVAGALIGAVCGLIIDAFSLGLFGLAGLSKTVTGFLAGFVSRKINVQPPGRMIVFAGLLGAADLALGVLLSTLIASKGFSWAGGWLLVQPAGTAILATAVLQVLRRMKARHER
jgi:rod shape-determining protein MreD